jgi:hypothetical protein
MGLGDLGVLIPRVLALPARRRHSPDGSPQLLNDWRVVVIPEHGTIKRGTLGSIIREAGLTPPEFLKLLD